MFIKIKKFVSEGSSLLIGSRQNFMNFKLDLVFVTNLIEYQYFNLRWTLMRESLAINTDYMLNFNKFSSRSLFYFLHLLTYTKCRKGIIFMKKSISVRVRDISKTTNRIFMKFGINPKSWAARKSQKSPFLTVVISKKIHKNHFK